MNLITKWIWTFVSKSKNSWAFLSVPTNRTPSLFRQQLYIVGAVISLILHSLFFLSPLQKEIQTQPIEVEYLSKKNSSLKRHIEALHKPHPSYFNKKPVDIQSNIQQRFQKQIQAEEIGVLKNKTQNAMNRFKNIPLKDSGNLQITDRDSKEFQTNTSSSSPFHIPLIEKGTVNFIDTDYSHYATFMNRIGKTLIYNYSKNLDEMVLFPHMKEKLLSKVHWSTLIELTIDAQGHYKNAIIVKSSGLPEFDANSLQSLKQSLPFLNPPEGLIEKDGSIRLMTAWSVFTRPTKWTQ